MTTESNQPRGDGQQPHYEPPIKIYPDPNPSNGVSYSWPGSDNNAMPPNVLPPITPNPPDSMPYLTQPNLDPQAELYRRAAKRADARLHFYNHLRSYLIVNVALWLIALFTGFNSGSGSFWSFGWPLWVTLFWGIGLVSEYVSVFMINDQRKQDMIEAEMRRMRH